jgi:hypothetical protein
MVTADGTYSGEILMDDFELYEFPK